MKNLLTTFIVLLSLNTLAVEQNLKDRYDEKQNYILKILDALQDNFSYVCGLDKFSKRKTRYRCSSKNSFAIVTIKKDPKVEDFRKKNKELSIDFQTSEDFPDFNQSIEDVLNNLGDRKLSYLCGYNKIPSLRLGVSKFYSNCSIRLNGEYLGEAIVKYSRDQLSKWRSFTVKFKQ
jgi:hypothetical protein